MTAFHDLALALDGSEPCAQSDPEAWFPSTPGPNTTSGIAKALCAGCPAVRACLGYALTHAVDGIWGGTSRKERQAIQALHGLTVTDLSSSYLFRSETPDAINARNRGRLDPDAA